MGKKAKSVKMYEHSLASWMDSMKKRQVLLHVTQNWNFVVSE